MVLANPCGNRITVTDLPVEALFCLDHCSGDARVASGNDATNFIHVSGLKPRLSDIGSVFVGEDPIEFVTISKCVLDEMHVLANPDIDTLLFNKWRTEGIFFQIGPFKVRTEACITLAKSAQVAYRHCYNIRKTLACHRNQGQARELEI